MQLAVRTTPLVSTELYGSPTPEHECGSLARLERAWFGASPLHLAGPDPQRRRAGGNTTGQNDRQCECPEKQSHGERGLTATIHLGNTRPMRQRTGTG